MVNSADELFALSQSGQEEWFQSHGDICFLDYSNSLTD